MSLPPRVGLNVPGVASVGTPSDDGRRPSRSAAVDPLRNPPAGAGIAPEARADARRTGPGAPGDKDKPAPWRLNDPAPRNVPSGRRNEPELRFSRTEPRFEPIKDDRPPCSALMSDDRPPAFNDLRIRSPFDRCDLCGNQPLGRAELRLWWPPLFLQLDETK